MYYFHEAVRKISDHLSLSYSYLNQQYNIWSFWITAFLLFTFLNLSFSIYASRQISSTCRLLIAFFSVARHPKAPEELRCVFAESLWDFPRAGVSMMGLQSAVSWIEVDRFHIRLLSSRALREGAESSRERPRPWEDENNTDSSQAISRLLYIHYTAMY